MKVKRIASEGVRALLPSLFLVILLLPLSAQESALPRVTIEVGALGERNPTVESLVSTISTTLTLSLALSGEVVLVEEGESADLLFSVELSQDDGGYLMRASRESAGPSEPQEIALRRAESLFDIFDVADALTLDIVSEVTDGEVAFGALRLVNRGFDRRWELLIDGVSLGEGVASVDRLLTGSRTVTIADPLGAGSTYYSETFDLAAGETREVTFALPWAPRELRNEATRALAAVRGRLLGAAPGEAEATEIPASAGNQEFQGRAQALLAEAPGPAGKRLPQVVLDALSESVGLSRSRFASPYPPALADAGRRIVAYGNAVMPDELHAWRWSTDFPPIRVDPARDEDPSFYEASSRSGTDLYEIHMQRSSEGLHFFMVFHDGEPMRNSASYALSLVADHVDGDDRQIELLWRLEGQGSLSATTAVWESAAGEDREIRTFRGPFDITDTAVIATIPEAAIDLASELARLGGWELEANVYEFIQGRQVARDRIDWADRIYF